MSCSQNVYNFQGSAWQWSDGSPVAHINWGLSNIYPDFAAFDVGHCTGSALFHGVPKLSTGPSSVQHCSAFEIFPDHSHASIFPVNCSAKYWSRLLCEDNQKHVTDDLSVQFRGHGEYWIDHNTLLRRKDLCPNGFHFVIDKLCMKLVLTEKLNNKFDSIELFERDHCRSPAIQLFQKFDKQASYSIGTLYVMIDILNELYAEGSDVFFRGAFFINAGYFSEQSGWSVYFWHCHPQIIPHIFHASCRESQV